MIQERLGVATKMEHAGRRGIRRYMPDQHREFFPQLPFIVVAALDQDGQPWASLLCNEPGFIQSPDATHLSIRAVPDKYDPLHKLLSKGSMIGMLGIQPHTRRRNRANGRVINSGTAINVEVLQSFGNCPKYIQARYCEYVAGDLSEVAQVVVSNSLDDAMLDIIRESDMFFIASAHPAVGHPETLEPQQGVDVSHRGGKPGFVKVENNELTIPDYIGNFFFNTLGNLLLNPKAGLVFIDFRRGTLLHLAVEAHIVWDGTEVASFPGAQRLLRFIIKEVRHVQRKLPLRWSGWELSPHLVDK